MRIIKKRTLVLFYEEHQDARTALEEWYEKVEHAELQIPLGINGLSSISRGQSTDWLRLSFTGSGWCISVSSERIASMIKLKTSKTFRYDTDRERYAI